MLIFVDWISLLTSAEITVLCVIYRAIFVGGRIKNLSSIEEKIGKIDVVLSEEEKNKIHLIRFG